MAPQEDTHEDDDLDNWKVAMPLAFKAIREDAVIKAALTKENPDG